MKYLALDQPSTNHHTSVSGSRFGGNEYWLSVKTGQITFVLPRNLMQHIWTSVDKLGKALLGDMWRSVYLSLQDAIALLVILYIPSLIGQLILTNTFLDFSVCMESAIGVQFYASLIIGAANFLLWILMAGRIIGRLWADFNNF
ncbi:hypothetical protein [Moorena producens]|uniref:hypothetical protein n=1 Tax=Moorena producens TaxID=1155739 RepID=UPI0009F24F01|nr:hypothetical protein [Moorena producens]